MKTERKKAEILIKKAKKIALFWHINPDGDCIGALLWLGRLLENQKKKVIYCSPTEPSRIYDFVSGIEKIKTTFDYKKYDLIIFTDFSWYDRISAFTEEQKKYFENIPIIVLDHHPGTTPHHGIIIKDIDSISTCEIIFECTYPAWKQRYDEQVATYLYLGITTDSANFIFEKNHQRTFGNALELLKLWADKDLIINHLYRKVSLKTLKFVQLLLNRIKQKGSLLYSYYSDEELKKYKIDQEEANYALRIIQDIDGPKVVLLLRKIENNIRGSLRSKDIEGELRSKSIIDCNKIAKIFWWGGHKPAAWFSMPLQWTFHQQLEKITDSISKMIR